MTIVNGLVTITEKSQESWHSGPVRKIANLTNLTDYHTMMYSYNAVPEIWKERKK